MRRVGVIVGVLVAWAVVTPGLDASIGNTGETTPVESPQETVPAPSEVVEPPVEDAGGSRPVMPAEVQEIFKRMAERRSSFMKRLGAKSADGTVNGYIVGGGNADITEAPYQVFLALGYVYDYPDSFTYWFFCGGSIIDEQWILTAAHCVVDTSGISLYVASGTSTNDGLSEDKFSEVERIVVHPNYNWWTSENDVALLKLKSPLTLDEVSRDSILLPSANNSWPAAGTSGLTTGWGASEYIPNLFDYTYPTTLQKATVKVLTAIQNPNCGLWPRGFYRAETMLCAGLPAGKTAPCFGDSGGPLMIEQDGKKVLAGVVSWGPPFCGQQGYPSVYARVTTFVPWIQSVLLSPQGKPIVSVRGANRSLIVDVDFSKVAFPDEAVLTNFEYRLDNARWVALSPPDLDGQFVLRNLRNGRRYSVSVRATNSYGTSEASDVVTGIPVASVPTPPLIKSVAPGNRTLSVDFSAPDSDGGSKITSYEYSLDGGKTWKRASSKTSPLVVRSLKNGVEYSVMIRARTIDGPGAPSVPVTGTPQPPQR